MESEARKRLEAALEAAQELDLDAQDDLSDAMKQTLLDQMAASADLLDQSDASDEAMTASKDALEKAVRLAQLDPSKNALQTMIDQAKALEESDYTEESWAALETALQAAREAIDDPDTMSDQGIATAAGALSAAIENLRKAPEPPALNDSLLEAIANDIRKADPGSFGAQDRSDLEALLDQIDALKNRRTARKPSML